MKIFLLTAILSLGFQSFAEPETSPGSAAHSGDHKMVMPKDIQWGPGPASLPAGVQFFPLSGDPTQPGAFTIRLKLPANYKIQAHTHPKDENVTVLSGEFFVGMGSKLDEKNLMRLPTGTYIHLPAGSQHYAMSKKGAIIQLHGQGPLEINYVNPADDPRRSNATK